MLCRKGLILTFLSLLAVSTLMATTTPNPSSAIQKMNQMPLAFTKNMGQWDERVLFRANAGGATMWFTKEGVTYQFTRTIGGHSREGGKPGVGYAAVGLDSRLRGNDMVGGRDMEEDSIEQMVLTAKFVGASPNPEVIAEGQMEYKCNYFIGSEPAKWHTDVPNYEAITLKDIYPGIDLKYSGDDKGQATYEFIVTNDADGASQGEDIPLLRGVRGVSLSQIKVEYEGAEATSIDADGRLILSTKWGDMLAAIKSPVYSPRPLGEGSGVRAVLSGSEGFSQLSEKTIGFEDARSSQQGLGTLSLVLSYSTYLGGGGDDQGYAIAVDGSGNAYVTGETSSSGFPTLNPYQTDQGGLDVFVTKLSSSGNSLIYSTYLGGGSGESAICIAVDGSGNAYVTGYTYSSDFPTLNPYQTDQGGASDVFVTKLSSSGDELIYSTYLGGGDGDWGYGIAADGNGYAYVTGTTASYNFPTLNPYQATYQGSAWGDAFVTKLSSSGDELIYSTYLGGGDGDRGYGIAADGNGNAYVTGMTFSSNFPTLNPYQSTFQGGFWDAFVTKLSSSGNSLIYSTYLGGGDDDRGYAIAIDGSGNAYVTGYTNSSNFPTLNPYQTDQGYDDAFVTKFSSTGNSLIYSTYLGGGSTDIGNGIAVDGSGYVYVTGWTFSSDFPTLDPYQTNRDTTDVFVTKLTNAGNSLIYSTYLGGEADDVGTSIAVDGSGNAYVTGYTLSSNVPTLNPYQTDQGGVDVLVTKLSHFGESDYVITPTPDTADVFYIKQADIDGDNRTDVIYTGNTSDSLYIACGKADGTLETPRNYLKVTKAALAVDFVNGDSLLDTVAHTTEKIYVLLNLGSRNFGIDSQTVSPSYRSSVFPSIATGYFNNDAHLDMVVSENKILFGNGTGGFSTSATLPFSFDAVAVSDFDHDGSDDIVVTRSDSAYIYLNNGSGTMTQSTALRIGYLTHDFTSVVSGMDLNHDGKTDFVTVTGNTIGTNDTSVVTIALGNGTGGVTGSDTLRIVGTALNLALADVDKDHNLDISLVNATTRSLLIVNNDGAGNFAPPVSIPLGSGTNPLYALISADVDRNGAPDFVIGGESGNPILLAVSEIPSDPILPDEMVTTGYNYVTLRVENPLDLVISRSLRTVAGSAYWRMDADDNDVLDESAYDYNLQNGEYRIVIHGRPEAPPEGSLFSVGIRIDGTAANSAFLQYSVPTPGDSLVFYYEVEPVSSIYPANGHPTANPQPTFDWSGLVGKERAADSYEFQLDRYYDLRSPIFSVTGLASPSYQIPHSLGADSVFYWRIRPVTGATPGAYSRTFAAYLLDYLCGDADANGFVNISDAVYLINYIFGGGPAPNPEAAGDADCNGFVNISDAVYLINYIFGGGAAPCAGCK